jgi:hypothetical protein
MPREIGREVSGEDAFRATAEALTFVEEAIALAESTDRLTGRILTLQTTHEFEPFLVWLSRRAPDLLSNIHWMIYGAQLELGKEARQPTFQDLQRLIHLVREERPGFLPFFRRVVVESPLGQAVEMPIPPVVTSPLAFLGESSASCVEAVL